MKQFLGLALILVGAALLIVCYVAGWQTNTELIVGLLLVVSGSIAHIWMQKHSEKY